MATDALTYWLQLKLLRHQFFEVFILLSGSLSIFSLVCNFWKILWWLM